MADVRRLPVPREGDWDWQVNAACRGTDTSNFYHPENERGPSRVRREMSAKAVCAVCPVLDDCRRWALAAREPYGVWGGLSADEREALLTQQPA
jgi:WhiB family redox-sensing transcriptional regulator